MGISPAVSEAQAGLPPSMQSALVSPPVAPSGAERRRDYRHPVDCAVTVMPISGSTKIEGRLVDLSRGGCRMESSHPVMIAIRMRVEVQFQLRGYSFRLMGVSQGTRGGRFCAIRFQDVSERRQEDLDGLLAELAELAAAAASPAAASPVTASPVTSSDTAANTAPAGNAEVTVIVETAAAATPDASADVAATTQQQAAGPIAVKESTPALTTVAAGAAAKAASSSGEPARPTAVKNLRAYARFSVDTSAKLLIIKSAISMSSRILDLSFGGCRLQTDEPFSLGIYVRVETEFYLRGLPFRLAGVTQAILDKHTIGVRFLDMSERKRQQLSDLIAELGEAQARQLPEPDLAAASPASGAESPTPTTEANAASATA